MFTKINILPSETSIYVNRITVSPLLTKFASHMMQSIEIKGIPVSYDVSGTGARPVVVMHGWGCDHSTVDVLARAASLPDTTVYNLDLPGFGATPEPDGSWGIYDYADLVEAFCKALALEHPVFIGHSFGGRISIILGERMAPAKMILVDAAGIKPRRKLSYYIKVYGFKLARHVLPLIMGRKRADVIIERMRGRAGSSDYSKASPVMRKIMSRTVNTDLRHHLSGIKCPVLLIWGGKDTATPISDAKLMEKLIPDAGLVEYPEADHYSFLRRPAQTDAVIKTFLN